MGPTSSRPFLAGRPEFHELVGTLTASAAVSYVLDSNLRFVFCNPAWDRFARENGGPELAGDAVIGSQLLPVIPDVLRPFYTRMFDEVQRHGLVWQHVYQCSSPQLFRKFRMRVHLLNSNWLMLSNALLVEEEHPRAASAHDAAYRNDKGLITMCAHCRCSQRKDEPGHWDFVPAHLKARPLSLGVSHGLCPICRAYFYPRYKHR
ncbi:MAG: hypothetical protein LAO03_21260 [Acidobacteriia bacterium]|nr:hypothetical protein [Terriglobia bacterium]